MNLVINSQFRPFTYDEMVKPLVQYKEVYDKIEQDYSDLVTQTEMWKDVVNQTNSPEAYAMYKGYSDQLNSIVEDFSKGMTLKNRSALLGMKRRYAQDIEPISRAHKRKESLTEEQRKASLANPTMLWQRNASEMSLDEFIENPTADYGKSVSGAALSAQVAAGAGALAKEFKNDPERMKKLVGGDYYEYVKQRGFSSEAVLAAIMDNPNASPVLRELVESSIDSSGIRDWANNSALQQAYNYARQGLWNAVGQDEAQLVQNWKAQEALSHSHAMARQSSAQEFQAAEAEKNRQFQKEQMAPREIVGKDGEATGTFYDPKLGVVTNKDGKIIKDSNGQISKVGTGSGRSSSPSAKVGEDGKPTEYAFKTASSVEDVKKLGYTPIFATQKHHKFGGKTVWYSGQEGDDVPGTWNDFGTSTSLISGDGNFTYTPPKSRPANMSVVSDFNSIPGDARKEIERQCLAMGVSLDEDIQIMRVSGQGGRKNDYDYIVFRNNDNL